MRADLTPFLRAGALLLWSALFPACTQGPALCGTCPTGSHCEGTRCVVDDLPAGTSSSSAAGSTSTASSAAAASSTGHASSLAGASSAESMPSSAGAAPSFSAAASTVSGPVSMGEASSADAPSSMQQATSSAASSSSGGGVQASVVGRFVGGALEETGTTVRVRGTFIASPPVDVTAGGIRLVGGFQ